MQRCLFRNSGTQFTRSGWSSQYLFCSAERLVRWYRLVPFLWRLIDDIDWHRLQAWFIPSCGESSVCHHQSHILALSWQAFEKPSNEGIIRVRRYPTNHQTEFTHIAGIRWNIITLETRHKATKNNKRFVAGYFCHFVVCIERLTKQTKNYVFNIIFWANARSYQFNEYKIIQRAMRQQDRAKKKRRKKKHDPPKRRIGTDENNSAYQQRIHSTQNL